MRRYAFAVMLALGLGLGATPALADRDVECSKIEDQDRRRECLERKREGAGEDVDCGKIDDGDARRECQKRKFGVDSRAQCRKIENAALRSACVAAKWD
jgi:hypothetical protein